MTKFITIDQAARDYRISKTSIYRFIKSDPSFPVLNFGPKKNT